MEDQKLNRVFDRVKLSPEREEAMLADLLREKKEVSSMKQTTGRRIPAAALAAAALVITLAGTAVAVGYFERLDILPVAGNYENGYEVTGAYQNIPLERLSEAVLAHAAQADGGIDELIFSSWSEAEEFLGLEIAGNPMLEEMAQSEWRLLHECDAAPEDVRRCTVQMCYSQGLPDQIMLRASYWGDYFEEGPFGVNVLAFMRVKEAEETQDMPVTINSRDIEVVNEEKYMTPKGIDATIITQIGTGTTLDGSSYRQHSYFAYFSYNNVMFQVITNFNEENADTALYLLKQVLDAYE